MKENGLVTTVKRTFSFYKKYGHDSLSNSLSIASRNVLLRNPLKVDTRGYFAELQRALKPSLFFKDYEDRSGLLPIFQKKLICFYLPQFHPFEENDAFWGKGFTEWTNVTKSFPLFKGHNQPRLPKDLGFYDLRLLENLRKQVEIAKNYGIYGFCFHYYWFSGQKVMETPINMFFENKSIDINYCICWANENWTRRWDGKDNEILLKQLDNDDDYLRFIEDVSKFFFDPRYIKINDAPVLIIYRAELLKNPSVAADIWRKHAKQLGFNDLYLILSESFMTKDPRTIGFDAAVDFAPNSFHMKEISHKSTFYAPNFQGHIFDYNSAIKTSLEKIKSYPFYKSICLEWDNSARKGVNSAILSGCTPNTFEYWLHELLNRKPLNDMVFVNAWNEWAEGTYLEPDRKNGFAYLQKCYEVINSLDTKINDYIARSNLEFHKKNDFAIVMHLHYFEAFDDVINLIESSELNQTDFIVSFNSNINVNQLIKIKSHLKNVYFYRTENRGRDVLPFFRILKTTVLDNYIACCKLHSKKSPHLTDGAQWRKRIYKELLNLSKYKRIINASDVQTVAWANEDDIKKIEGSESINDKRLRSLLRKSPEKFNFISGTMFWFRPLVFKKIIKDEYLNFDFEYEPIETDGSWAHVFERFFMAKIELEELKVKSVASEKFSNL